MTYPDPEDQERDGAASQGRSRDSADNLPDTNSEFARIVAGLRADPDQHRWPVQDPNEAEDDHFDPPEPPPLPIPRPRTVGGVLALMVGVLLLVAPNLLGVGEHAATPLGLLTLTAGIGWLVIGLRPDPPPERLNDDGARL